MRSIQAAAVCAILLTAAAPVAAAPRSADTVGPGVATTIDHDLTAAADSGFSGAVILESKGEIVLQAGYGLANRESATPFTVETIAQIGSITKPLTAIAVLQLAEQGRLNLNGKAKTYLNDAEEPAASATLDQLLTHHAGLTESCAEDFDRLTRADLLHRCMGKPLAHSLSEEAYSNLGYSILAAIVEQVSDETWESYLRHHVFDPLGMSRTGFTFPPSNTKDFATGYLNGVSQGVISDRISTLGGDDWALRGNGGVQASAMDMERLYRGLAGRAPGLSRSIFDSMSKPRDVSGDHVFDGYGFAIRTDDAGAPYRIGAAGSDGTFFSYFAWYPKDDVFLYFVGSNGEAAVKPSLLATLKTLQSSLGKPQK